MADIDYLKKLQQAMMGEDAPREEYVTAPEEAIEAVNEQAESPYMQEKEGIQPEDVMNIPRASRDIASIANQNVESGQHTDLNKEKPLNAQEKLIQELRGMRSKSKEEAAAAQEDADKKALWANVIRTLGNLGQADVQRGAGIKVGLTPAEMKQAKDVKAPILKERDAMMKQLMDEYKLLQQSEGKMTPYQQAQIDIAKQKAKAESLKPKPKTKLQEEKEKLTAKRYANLEEQMPERTANIKEARELIKLLKTDQLDTGPGSALAGDIGSFFDTEESTYKQRLDSLAEKAARAALKANGEVRPTDADVEGMKRAMFNLGNTESANIKKLEDFIKQQESGIEEYTQMKDKLKSGKGLEDFVLNRDDKEVMRKSKQDEMIKKMKERNPNVSEERIIKALKYKGLM